MLRLLYTLKPQVKARKSSVSTLSGIVPVRTLPNAIMVAACEQTSTARTPALSHCLISASMVIATRSCSWVMDSPVLEGITAGT